MSNFTKYIGSQFGDPRGFVGKCCCLIMNIINNVMYRRTISVIHLTKKSTVLDIGYGNGYFIRELYKSYEPNIFGIDISEDMKTTATKRNLKAIEQGKIHLQMGDCCQLSYDDNFFNAVTSINTVYFWSDTLKGLKEICRTLKPQGIFYNVVYTKEWLQKLSYTETGFKFFEKEDFINLGKQAGFSKVKIHNITKDKSFLVTYQK